MPRRIWDLVRLVWVEVGFRKRGFFRLGSRLCKNSDIETFRATIESGRQHGRIIVAAKANFMIQYFVSVSK